MSQSSFLDWLKLRRHSESLAAIGQDLGVSAQSVRMWLTGERRPARTVLILAELLRKPVLVDGEWR